MVRRSTHRRSKRTKGKGRRRTHRYYEKGGMPIIGGTQALSPAKVGGGGPLSALSPATFNEGLSGPIAKPMRGGQPKLSPAMVGGSGDEGDGKETFRGHGSQNGGNPFAAALVPFSILGAQKYYQNNRRKGKSKRFSRAVKRYF